jgi:hypothetical protein
MWRFFLALVVAGMLFFSSSLQLSLSLLFVWLRPCLHELHGVCNAATYVRDSDLCSSQVASPFIYHPGKKGKTPTHTHIKRHLPSHTRIYTYHRLNVKAPYLYLRTSFLFLAQNKGRRHKRIGPLFLFSVFLSVPGAPTVCVDCRTPSHRVHQIIVFISLLR